MAIVLAAGKKSELTALTRASTAHRRHWRSGRASFWLRLLGSTIRRSRTLETRPKGATHWSLRTMAKEIADRALDRTSHLERVRAAAAPRRDLQTLARSVVRGEGA